MKMNVGVLALIFSVFSSSVWAEVSDKIIMPNQMITYSLLLSVVAIVLLRKWPVWFPIITSFTILLSWGGLATVLDPYVGPAAIAEQGVSYKYIAYLTVIVVVLANLIGIIWGYKLRKAKNA